MNERSLKNFIVIVIYLIIVPISIIIKILGFFIQYERRCYHL
nr:MAG TPA: hypothetical protein [Bacteriophage sp.]